MISFPELTNLLPSSQVKTFKREYFLRLATIAVLLLSGVVFAGLVLLIPSYIYERQTAQSKTAMLAQLSTNLATSAEQQANEKAKSITAKLAAIQKLGSSATASTALRAVLAVARPGVILTGFTFTPPGTSGNQGNMQLSGVATTRESLRTYVTALGALPFVSNADLPISAYAQASNINFAITLTGSLQP